QSVILILITTYQNSLRMLIIQSLNLLFFSSHDTPPTEFYTLSLHDALPIFLPHAPAHAARPWPRSSSDTDGVVAEEDRGQGRARSEEHTSELQSLTNLVCRLLLEKKKKNKTYT